MDNAFEGIRRQAIRIADGFPTQDFYRDHRSACRDSLALFKRAPVVRRIHNFLIEKCENDFGHGLDHLTKVALDAGALMLIEGKAAGYSPRKLHRGMVIGHCAGLLHDIKRKEKNHAEKSADFTMKFLGNYPLTRGEKNDIVAAIRNHEAFKAELPIASGRGALLSNCLYDADKFRWGPDNFTATIWEMVAYSKVSLCDFMKRYPKGMEILCGIGRTFRTATGKAYGPRFIKTGLSIGTELSAYIDREYPDHL